MEPFYKLLVILILSVLNSSAEDNEVDPLQEAYKLCQATHESDEQCFVQCTFKKVDWLDDSGNLSEEKIIQYVESHPESYGDNFSSVIKGYKKCLGSVVDIENSCEASARYMMCLIEEPNS